MIAVEAEPDIERGERLRVLRAVEALLRMQRLVMDHFPDEDMETVTVLLTVAAGSMSVVHRNEAAHDQMMAGPLPREWFRPISGRAVAASCGLPRETVRRRLEHLEKLGEIERVDGGYQLCPDILSRRQNLPFARALVREFETVHRMIERCDLP
ncbi:MAG TPA: hypothetical protein PLE81_04365 [Brevundimonas sp.]|jgi:biotin operon repressor|uniref:hypothetical protein n=1 Tax=Brevundimonas sp. TaxID=1871086 RepID=UPI002CA3208E|nr:hypothetical protein [Brevundimonas sp.]HRH19855.1 hypothetical protein [Brevundimonas sp.]